MFSKISRFSPKLNFFLLSQASRNVDVLKDQEAVKQLGSILKTNVRACKALGHPFVVQLGRIYLDMLNVYKVSYFWFNHNVNNTRPEVATKMILGGSSW